jgi:hypothetical protein
MEILKHIGEIVVYTLTGVILVASICGLVVLPAVIGNLLFNDPVLGYTIPLIAFFFCGVGYEFLTTLKK